MNDRGTQTKGDCLAATRRGARLSVDGRQNALPYGSRLNNHLFLVHLSVSVLTSLLSCTPTAPPVTLPVETEFSLDNFSQKWYATIGLRPAASLHGASAFGFSKLIPPAGVFRQRFRDLFPQTGGCPDRLDLQVYLYKRVNDTVPIGLDPGEQVNPTAVASAEFDDILACEQVVASTFTIVLLDTDEGSGRLRIAQQTNGEIPQLDFSGRALPDRAVPELLPNAALEGRVILNNGSPLANIGVLVRGRYRRMIDDSETCAEEPTGFCFSDPIAFTSTDANGFFSFNRPAGAYQVEVFGDGFVFRPVFVIVESPVDNIVIGAEPQ